MIRPTQQADPWVLVPPARTHHRADGSRTTAVCLGGRLGSTSAAQHYPEAEAGARASLLLLTQPSRPSKTTSPALLGRSLLIAGSRQSLTRPQINNVPAGLNSLLSQRVPPRRCPGARWLCEGSGSRWLPIP